MDNGYLTCNVIIIKHYHSTPNLSPQGFPDLCCNNWPTKWDCLLASQWRHNGHNSISNHRPHHCLFNRLFRRRSKKTSKLRFTGLCVGNSPGTCEFPAQRASNTENVSIWWRHHGNVNPMSTFFCKNNASSSNNFITSFDFTSCSLPTSTFRDMSKHAPSQWEMSFQCNNISHWLGGIPMLIPALWLIWWIVSVLRCCLWI